MSDDTRRKRVLFVLPALDAGGAERVLITLMNGLDRRRYKPVLLSVRGQGALQHLVSVSTPFYGLNQGLSAFSYLPLLRQIKALKPDIIVSTMSHMNFAILALKPLFPQTRFIVREAITPSFFLQKYARWSSLLKFAYKTLYPLADLVLSPTQKVFDEFNRDMNLTLPQARVLKNPVHVETIRKAIHLPPAQEERKTTVHFLACGRLGKQKGFDQLIEKLDQLNIPYDWKLDILGEGAERPYLEELIAQKGLEDKVFLKGLVIPPYSYFAAADCFLLPSRFEGLPNVVLEALACGTPVIATATSGGIDEIACDCDQSRVNIVKDMDQFMQAMQKITPNPKTQIAAPLLATCYDRTHVLENFDALLQDVLNTKR